MKKLLFVAPSVRYGGAAKNFIGVANYAVEKGYDVTLLTEEGIESMRFINPQIKQIKSKIDYNDQFYKRLIQCVAAVRKAIREYKIDLVISFIEPWRSACVLATRFTKTKCLVSERADPYSRGKKHDKAVFEIFSMAEGHVFQTVQARDFFGERVKKKSRVIHNPVFKEDMLKKYTGEKKNIIVNIARLDLKQKRQDILIKAFNSIKDEFPAFLLYLYGGGSDEDKIKELIEDLGLKERVILKGITTDVYNALGEAKLMVLSSDYEGIPNAIIESMCVGVPVVSTKCSPGGAELLICDNENGLLVERGDVDGLAVAMRNILSNAELADKFIQNGFGVKERFKQEDVLNQWIDYIEMI